MVSVSPQWQEERHRHGPIYSPAVGGAPPQSHKRCTCNSRLVDTQEYVSGFGISSHRVTKLWAWPPVRTMVSLSGIPHASSPLCCSANFETSEGEKVEVCLPLNTWNSLCKKLCLIPMATQKDNGVRERWRRPGCVSRSPRTVFFKVT